MSRCTATGFSIPNTPQHTPKKELLWVYSRLADEKSRETLENTVNFKLGGENQIPLPAAVSHDEPFKAFLRLCDEVKLFRPRSI